MLSMQDSNSRLTKLAKFLKTVPPSRFNFWIVLDNFEEGAPIVGARKCGTKACAMGWAASMNYFQRMGVTVSDGGEICYKGETEAFSSSAKLFGLTADQSEYLFSPGAELENDTLKLADAPEGEASPTEVANHILRFVRAREKAAKRSRRS